MSELLEIYQIQAKVIERNLCNVINECKFHTIYELDEKNLLSKNNINTDCFPGTLRLK